MRANIHIKKSKTILEVRHFAFKLSE